jgi:hypothetical protein
MTKWIYGLILAIGLTNIVACKAKQDHSAAPVITGPTSPLAQGSNYNGTSDYGGDSPAPATTSSAQGIRPIAIGSQPHSGSSSEGPGSGNGGKGVLIDGKPYLLDLVEAGLEKSPHFDEKVAVDPKILERVKKIFPDDKVFPVERIAQKISEVMEISFNYGLLMMKTMELFEWRLVAFAPKVVNDQREGVEVKPQDYVQIAKRLHHAIIFDEHRFPQMDEANRTATVFHEIAYAFATPIDLGGGKFRQDTGAVQEFTALLFSTELRKDNLIHRVIHRIFPKEFNFGGHQPYREAIGEVGITPDVHLSFRTLQQLNDDTVKPIVDSTALFFFTGQQLEDPNYLVNAYIPDVCDHLPATGQYLLVGSTKDPYMYLYVDFYNGPGDQFYSYVKVVKHDGGDIETVDNPTNFITKENCPATVKEIIGKLDSYLKANYQMIPDRYR